MSLTVASICAADGGSPCRCRSVSRTQPMFTERAPATPSVPPSTNSVEPPPMSVTRYGGGHDPSVASGVPASSLVAPVNDSQASSSPVMTSGSTPRMPRTRSVNSWAFAASLVALVATILTAAGFASAISPAYSRSAVMVRSSAAAASRPVRSTPSPRRTMRI
jgi:hypothetical protein